MPSTNHSRECLLLRVIKYMHRYIKVITIATLYFLPFVRKINRTRLDIDKSVFELCLNNLRNYYQLWHFFSCSEVFFRPASVIS